MNLKFRELGLFISLALIASSSAVIIAEEKESELGFLFAGSFEKADITSDVQGAKKSLLAAAYTWSYGVLLFTDKTWDDSGLKWEDFANRAGILADKLASNIKPEYIRNESGVIDYAIVSDKSPFLSSAITSPDFLVPFEDTLGASVHVLVVDRNVLYVFPGTGGRLGEFAPALVRIFKQTPKPVSLEIFEVDRNGYRVIGEIERGPRDVKIEKLEKYKLE